MDLVKRVSASWPSALAVLAGLCWGQTTAFLAFVTLSIVALLYARTRLEAWAVGTLYHVVATRSLIVAAASFFHASWLWGLVAVGVFAAVLGGVWARCWSPRLREELLQKTALRLAVLFVVTSLPGLGSVAAAHPLQAAGVLCVGFGTWGLLVTFALLVAARTKLGAWLLVAWSVVAFGAWQYAGQLFPEERWVRAVSTSVDTGAGTLDFDAQWLAATSAIERARHEHASVLVLPESVGGLWQPSMQRLWAPLDDELRAQGRVALVGAALPRPDGDFDNGVVVLGAERAPYRQRIPIPLAMWRPWEEGQGEDVFHAHPFGTGLVEVMGKKLGVFVCFEASLFGVGLATILEGAEVLVAVANAKWLRGTGAVAAQRQSLESWAALFQLPLVFAVNE